MRVRAVGDLTPGSARPRVSEAGFDDWLHWCFICAVFALVTLGVGCVGAFSRVSLRLSGG